MARDDREEDAIDPTRREFFRHFGRESIRNAGAVVGAAAEIRRAGNVAARDMLDMAGPPSQASRVEREDVAETGSAPRTGSETMRSSCSTSASFPVECHPVACRAIGGLVGHALGCDQRRAHPRRDRGVLACAGCRPGFAADLQGLDRQVRSAANTLRTPRSDVHALRAAVDRIEAAYEQLTGGVDAGVDDSARRRGASRRGRSDRAGCADRAIPRLAGLEQMSSRASRPRRRRPTTARSTSWCTATWGR